MLSNEDVQIWDTTAGNPLFLEEMLRMLVEDGDDLCTNCHVHQQLP